MIGITLVLILLKSWYSCSFSNTCFARAIWAGGKFELGFVGVVGVVESLLESLGGVGSGVGVKTYSLLPIGAFVGTSFRFKSKCKSQFVQHHSFAGSMLRCGQFGLSLLISINSLQ